ncbi:RICIN domain-containing protein [Actinosynnema sp. NPDC020468]|uniref:RICIN domain-containing protein n=1 Tax=Actinosynnema sp. NPDC020468 TaxID=3154488 RepID=UPI0033D688E2
MSRFRGVVAAAIVLTAAVAPPAHAQQQLWNDRAYLANPTAKLVVDVFGYQTGNGVDVITAGFHGDRNQQFELTPTPRNPYAWEIRAVHSNRCLDVEGESTREFARVQQWDCRGSDNQSWYPDVDHYDAGNQPVYRLRNVRSNLCLDIPTDTPPGGARLRQARCAHAQNQEWTLNHPISNPATGRVMDVWGVSTGANAWVWLWNFEGGRNQYWWPSPVGDGTQQLVVLHSRQCLDVDGGATYYGAPLVQRPCDLNRRSRRWLVERTSWDRWNRALYRIRGDQSGRCVTISAQPDSLGARLRVQDCTGGLDQQWRM